MKKFEKVWKSLEKFGKVWKSLEKFGNRVFRTFGNLGIVLFQTFQKLQKMELNSNFGYREKLVPTRKPTQKFG